MNEIRMGLPPPANGATDFLPPDFNAMRQAIDQGARDSALISRCLRMAQMAGLSGEDTYVLLAYHALIALEQQWRLNVEAAMRDPRSPPVVRTR